MNSLQEFFEKSGLPSSWVTEDGDILVNPDDSGADPDVNDGDEVFVSSDDIIIEGNEISVRAVCSPGNFKERFSARPTMGDIKKMLNEKEEFESGAWTAEL